MNTTTPLIDYESLARHVVEHADTSGLYADTAERFYDPRQPYSLYDCGVLWEPRRRFFARWGLQTHHDLARLYQAGVMLAQDKPLEMGEYGESLTTIDDLLEYLLAPESRTTYPHCLLYDGIVNKVGVQVMFDARSLILWLIPDSKNWARQYMDDATFTLTARARLILAYERGDA